MSTFLGSLYGIITFFLITLALFHVHVFVARPDARFLKKIDYWWLGFAALSLLSLGAERRKLLAQFELTYAAQWEKFASDDVARFAAHAKKWACDTNWLPPQPGLPGKERYESRYIACTWYSDVDKRLNSPDFDRLAVTRQLTLSPPAEVQEYWRYNPLETSLRDAQNLISQDDSIRGEEIRSDTEKLLILISPYLFAIALALRIAKVTGELRIC